MAMKPHKLHEAVDFGDSVVIDRGQFVLNRVKLSGSHSKNGRLYTDEALANIAQLSVGLPIYTQGHVGEGQRNAFDRNGKVIKAWREGSEVFGTAQFLPNHPTTPLIFDNAEISPENIMFSHEVRDGDWHYDEEEVLVVERVTKMSDYALVSDGGITNSLFESLEQKEMAKELTFDEFQDKFKDYIERAVAEATVEAPAAEEQVPEGNLQVRLQELIVENERLSSENETMKEELDAYRKKEEEAARDAAISKEAVEIVGESYVVKDSLRASLQLLDEESRRTVFKEIASNHSPKQNREDKPASRSGTSASVEVVSGIRNSLKHKYGGSN